MEPVLEALVVVLVELDEVQVALVSDALDVALDALGAELVEPGLDALGEVPDAVLDALDEAQDVVLGSLEPDVVQDEQVLDEAQDEVQDALESPDEVPEPDWFHDEMEYGVGETEPQLQEYVLG